MMNIHVSEEQASLHERQEELVARLAELKGKALRTVLDELFDVSASHFMPKGELSYEQIAVTAHKGALDFLEATIGAAQTGVGG